VYVIYFDNIALGIAATFIARGVSCLQAHAQLIDIQLKVVKDRYFGFLPFILQVLLLLSNHNIGKNRVANDSVSIQIFSILVYAACHS
jgi:hypothetical protein